MYSSVFYAFTYISISLLISGSANPLNDNICGVCKCTFERNTANIDCSKKDTKIYFDDWITFTSNINTTKYTHFIMSFKGNTLNDLNVLPKANTSLVDLSFFNCNLTKIKNGAFQNIVNLKTLDLSFNKLKGNGIKGNIFRSSTTENINLEVLNLGNNLFHSIDKKMFKYTPKLRVLYLNDNPFEVFDMVTMLALSHVTQLEVLDISRTEIINVPDDLLRNLKNLKELYLSGNKITTVPESLSMLGDTLEILVLNENQIVEIDDNSFMGLWRLEILELSGMTTLTTVKENAFIQLKSLMRLHLCANPSLEYISGDAFDGLKINWRLKEIRLNDNKIESLSKELIEWNSTDDINLENNPWKCDCHMANLLETGFNEKLTKDSHPRCATPSEMSGTELSDVRAEDVCTSDGKDKFDQIRPTNGRKTSKPNGVLITFSVLIMLAVVGIIIGIRIGKWKKKLQNAIASPVRYTNMDRN